MVAAARLLDLPQVVVELLLRRPGRAVDALQHRSVFVAAPISARHAGQLEGADVVRAMDVRTTAQIDPVLARSVEADLLVVGEALDNLAFVRVVFALRVVRERLILGPFFALEGFAGGDDLAHRGFDAGQVVFADLGRNLDVVIEAVVDDRADAQLAARVQPLDRFGQHVRCRMAHDVEVSAATAVVAHDG